MLHGGNLPHDMEYHPLANVFPLLSNPELQELADDIRDHGLKEPIWIYEGKILDGRNRSAACRIAGVEPEIKEFRGTAEEAFRHVWSLNFHRRHMTQSQKGACAADATEVLEICWKKAKGRQGKRADRESDTSRKDFLEVKQSRDEVGEMFRVSGRYVDDAVAVKRENPELHEKVKSGEMTLPQAKREIRLAARNEILREMEWPEGKYRVLYADPPWRYEHCKTSNRRIENQYPTMDLDAICNMKISEITTPDSVLFLWATSPKLYEVMKVVDAWGFTYRTCIVWDKGRIGMGYYARQQHETLLICTKGSPSVPVEEHRPCSVIRSPREGHSRKPDRFRELIDAMYPYGPRIELFARTKRDGWDVWGNEVQVDAETQSTDSPVLQTQVAV